VDELTQAILPLSVEEQEQLAVCEAEISEGIATFWTVGQALAQISAKRLYREKHETFQIYCSERWGMSRQNAYRLIESCDVFENVPGIQTERQARAIKKYEKDVQQVVWTIAESTAPKVGGKPKVSAGHLAAVAEVMSGILLAGGMDDGSGEIKPIGTLLDAHITEVVYERLARQKEIVRQKLSENGKKSDSKPTSASENGNAPSLPLNGESPATPKAEPQAAAPEMKARLLLRTLETWIVGEDKERADRQTAMHPAKYAVYHFTMALLGKEKFAETEMRALGAKMIGECDSCGTAETQVEDYVFTNTSTQRLSSVRLALCGGCVESYQALNEGAKGE
jgi:hypothetical protein